MTGQPASLQQQDYLLALVMIASTHPPHQHSRQPQWIIVDGLQGGSGEAFDWARLREQAAAFAPHSTHGWLLAGGLTPDSVAGGWEC